MTDGQYVFLIITFILTIFNFIFFIVSFKVDGETDEEFREKFSLIFNKLVELKSHKEKVEKVLKLDNEK